MCTEESVIIDLAFPFVWNTKIDTFFIFWNTEMLLIYQVWASHIVHSIWHRAAEFYDETFVSLPIQWCEMEHLYL